MVRAIFLMSLAVTAVLATSEAAAQVRVQYGRVTNVQATTVNNSTSQNVHGDTRVFDVAKSEVVWSAATTTATGWDSVPQLMDQFVRLIVDTLKQDGVI